MRGITLTSEDKTLYPSKSWSNNKPPTKGGYKNFDKRKVTNELHNLGELRRMTTRIRNRRDLKVFATIVERRATCPRIIGPRKKSVEINATISKK